MNSSNNNNIYSTASGDYDCYGSGGFNFVYENTKPNKKKSSKSHNFREVIKAGERNEKVDALIGELPKKMQKQLKLIQTPTTEVKKVNISKKGKNKGDTTEPASSSRGYSKTAANTDFSAENSEYYEGINDAAEERTKIKGEQQWEAYAEWLNEEYEQMLKNCQEAHDNWVHYQECTDDLEWSWATELRLKRDFDEYCVGVNRMGTVVGTPVTRTIQEYEADTLRKESALAKALEINAKMIERSDMRIKRQEQKREEAEKLRTKCYFGNNLDIYDAILKSQKNAEKVWLETQFADAVIMDKLACMADPKFAEYVIWLEEDGCESSDRRYVTWSQKKEEKTVAEDDSKYDELPLHERYTWCKGGSDSEDEESSVEDFSDY
jgi:hypothetical protein